MLVQSHQRRILDNDAALDKHRMSNEKLSSHHVYSRGKISRQDDEYDSPSLGEIKTNLNTRLSQNDSPSNRRAFAPKSISSSQELPKSDSNKKVRDVLSKNNELMDRLWNGNLNWFSGDLKFPKDKSMDTVDKRS